MVKAVVKREDPMYLGMVRVQNFRNLQDITVVLRARASRVV
jgi:hypothetical protein